MHNKNQDISILLLDFFKIIISFELEAAIVKLYWIEYGK